MSSVEQVLTEAMSLTSDEREMVAVQLFASLDRDPGYEDAWAAEIASRLAQIETGKVAPIPGDEVLSRLERRLLGDNI